MPNFFEIPEWLGKMESILEELNEGVIIGDNEMHIVFVNEALLELSQYQREELLGHTPDAVFPPAFLTRNAPSERRLSLEALQHIAHQRSCKIAR